MGEYHPATGIDPFALAIVLLARRASRTLRGNPAPTTPRAVCHHGARAPAIDSGFLTQNSRGSVPG
jgi:hypothetical protein